MRKKTQRELLDELINNLEYAPGDPHKVVLRKFRIERKPRAQSRSRDKLR